MEVEPVLTPDGLRKRLLRLIATCASFSWASAWVTETDVFAAAMAASSKMRRFVIGTHCYFTDVACLEACLPFSQAKVMAPEGPMFHPKLYAFELNRQVIVYVGSSNLTGGGLANNVECGVFLKGNSDDPQLRRLINFIEQQWVGAKTLDEDFIAIYRANLKRVEGAKAELERFTRIPKPIRTKKSANDVDPLGMDWETFVRLVRLEEHRQGHKLTDRLKVLSRARELFTRTHFAKLPEIDRKCLAGIQRPAKRDGIDWGFFGQMSSFGRYFPILRHHVDRFSAALDEIPIVGTIRRSHFDAYRKKFLAIPDASPTWIGLGTRLLAMKRSDWFVCVDAANRVGLCYYFGVAPTTTNLDNYWERIIEPMSLMPWWQMEMPRRDEEQEIWRGRAALLDAIYYNAEA